MSNRQCLISFFHCQRHLEDEWWEIDSVFTAVIALVEEAHAAALQPLKERRLVMEREAKELTDELEEEIKKLNRTISELDDISALEDHILFLQVSRNFKPFSNFMTFQLLESTF